MPKRRPVQVDTANPPKTLRPDEAAAYIGIHPSAYYRYVHPAVAAREILSMPIGRQRRIVTASLDAWLAKQAKEGWR